MDIIDSYTIGSDPEGFLFDQEREKYIPSCDLIGAGKENPVEFEEGFGVLEDNVMVEYNIPPSTFGDNLKKDIEFASRFIEKAFFGDQVKIHYKPSVEFEAEDLLSPKAQEFGCLPDMSVWSLMERDICLSDTNIRYAGGHVHFGVENGLEIEESIKLVKLFDLCLGVPSVILDTDNERRKLYGQAGSFRYKPYGFEYRTLSNYWVKSEEDLINKQIKMAVGMFNTKFPIEKEKENIQQAINNPDKDKAKSLINEYGLLI